ncbi:MAG: hypothetical protein E6Q36_02725 [Chryseobacterium sp.]|nr:MAG: hypothetical protein E6Q36_02725 [Chryseobacterium sp.]
MSRKSRLKVGKNVVSTKSIPFGSGKIPGGCPGIVTKKGQGSATVKFDYYDQTLVADCYFDEIVLSSSHP